MAGHLDHVTNGLRVGSGHFADVKLLIAFLLHFSNHLLEDGTAFDGLEDLRGNTVGDASDALFHKCLTLRKKIKNDLFWEANAKRHNVNLRSKWLFRTSVLNTAAVWRKTLQISCIPSVSQVEFSRHAKVAQPTCRAPFRQRATSAGGRRNNTYLRDTLFQSSVKVELFSTETVLKVLLKGESSSGIEPTTFSLVPSTFAHAYS